MSWHDLSFWAGSARADKLLIRLRREHGDVTAFDRLYQQMPDPWSTTVSRYRYQLLKYQRMLALLPERRFRNALDIGCGLGVMTRMLARRADQVLGLDLSPTAVAQAERLSLGTPGVRFLEKDLLRLDTSAAAFDLATFVDTIYYLPDLTEAAVRAVGNILAKIVAPGGLLLLANHYYFGFDPYSRQTRRIHQLFRLAPDWRLQKERRYAFFLASIFERAPSAQAVQTSAESSPFPGNAPGSP